MLTVATRKRVLDLRAFPHSSHHQQDDAKARVGVLFSGGLDCATLALLASHILPEQEPIDLLNVAFENPRTQAKEGQDVYEVPDRITARSTYSDLCRLQPQRRWNLVFVNVTQKESMASQNDILDLMAPQDTEMDLVQSWQPVVSLLMVETECAELGYCPQQSSQRSRDPCRLVHSLSIHRSHSSEWSRRRRALRRLLSTSQSFQVCGGSRRGSTMDCA